MLVKLLHANWAEMSCDVCRKYITTVKNEQVIAELQPMVHICCPDCRLVYNVNPLAYPRQLIYRSEGQHLDFKVEGSVLQCTTKK